MKRTLYPLFVDLQDRPVLVVGAGPVGSHKTKALLAAGAAVTVVAPQASDFVQTAALRGELRWQPRPFAESDLEGVYFVIAATGDSAVNAEVAHAATARQLLVNAVDDPASASAYASAQLHRGGVTVAISSGGRAPAVARLLRELLEQLLPSDETLLSWVSQAESLRAEWQQARVPLSRRYRSLLQHLANQHSDEKPALTAVPSPMEVVS